MGRKVTNASLRVGYLGYRGWAFALLDRLLGEVTDDSITFSLIATVPYTTEKLDYSRYADLVTFDPKDKKALVDLVDDRKPDVLLFYGWSWLVPDELTMAIDCLCLHPSLLPNYRGGCPLQHQVLNDEKEGGLTIFRMNNVLDGGDILAQREFSLTGSLSDIFKRVVDYGAEATVEILRAYQDQSVVFQPQGNLDQWPVWPRRIPAASEISYMQLATMSTRSFYNFVRALDDPYPNAYIKLPHGDNLRIREVRLSKTPPSAGRTFDGTEKSLNDHPYITLADGYAILVRFDRTA